MSAVKDYAELLKLIEISGPFLSLPVFREAFPQGLSREDTANTAQLRQAYDEWRAVRNQRTWIQSVFSTLLGWPEEILAEDNAIPQPLFHTVPLHHLTLRPDMVLKNGDATHLLIQILPPDQDLNRRPPNSTWNASCSSRMAELLRATRVPLGLLTNGERWQLVYAESDKPTGTAEWRAELWFDERHTLRAFRDLLATDAFFNRPDNQTPAALYRRSLDNQQEVSAALGRQVRRAVELFVAALDRADREQQRALLRDVPPETIYEAALAVLMRLVFLLFAEERDLLPINDPIYQSHYAVSTIHAQLRRAGDEHSEELLERRYDAYVRLLATFRVVHSGAQHDVFQLRAYEGQLFDPDRFPFLEGRPAGSKWRDTPAAPVPIHNRTILHLLEALQFLEMKVPGGGTERRPVSFRALDIEQIGHVYEGLLDHTVKRAAETIVGLAGPEEPEIPLSLLKAKSAEPGFIEWLQDQTGRSAAALQKAAAQPDFAGLIRRDDNGEPVIIAEGSF